MNNEQLDLVKLVSMNIEAEIGTPAANTFLQHEFIRYVVNKEEPYQRMNINRYFNALLLKFRAEHDIDVNDAMFLLVNDGDSKEWMKIIKHIIIPFCKEHKLLG